jgi:D-sedoheptulose 7-phosphate isomerase
VENHVFVTDGWTMSALFLDNIRQQQQVLRQLEACDSVVGKAAALMAQALKSGGKVMFCGNGGSAADSQHLAAELTGRFIDDRVPLAGLALSTDTSALTCIANDYSFDDVFARQVVALGRPGDVLIGISTSGNSRNVLRAVEQARMKQVHVIGLLGKGGGELAQWCDIAIIVPSDVTARIQESHILIGHTLCGLVEQQLGFD